MYLRQSTASQEIQLGAFVDSVDGSSAETALTIANTDIKLFKHGATSQANKNSGGGTHMANGYYSAVLDATDTNTLGNLEVTVNVAGALGVRREFVVLPAMIFDSLILGTDRLDANVTHVGDTVQTAGDIFARLPALVGGRVDASVGAMAANVLTATAINADALTAAKVAADVGTEIGTAVWATTTRLLTAGTNIALAKGTGVTGFNDLSAAQVNAEVDTGIADAALATAANLATAVGYIDTEVAAILADTNELQTDWANGGRLDLILDARASQTSVDDLPTNAELATALGTADDAVLTAIGDLPTNAELATALGTADDAILAQVALVKATTDKLDDTLEDDAGTYRFTTNALEQAPSGGSAPSAATIADAVWDEVLSGHAGAGSTGEALGAAGSAGDPWTTALPGAYSAGQAGKIIGDNLNATIGSRASQTSVDDVPTNAELATALGTADDAVLAAIAALNNLSQANIRTALGMASANFDTQIADLPTNGELTTALAGADDAILAAVAALNNLSSAQVQTAAAAALTAYDPPTRAEATADKDAIITEVNANETKIDTLDTVADAMAVKVGELYQIQGLDAANPMTVTPNSREAAAIELVLTGDGETTTTVTRQ